MGLRDSTKIIYSERADHNNIQTVEANANDFLPSSRLSYFMCRIYLIKTLPPYTSIPVESKSPLLPPMRDKKRFTLVVLYCMCDVQILDLDETIVHCAMQPLNPCHHRFPVSHAFCFHLPDYNQRPNHDGVGTRASVSATVPRLLLQILRADSLHSVAAGIRRRDPQDLRSGRQVLLVQAVS